MEVKIKRAYQQPSDQDGVRILVDRIWPRGVSKKEAKIDYWLRQISPSTELRKWFNHEPSKYELFKERYKCELHTEPEKEDQLQELLELVKGHEQVTLVYGAKDKKNNQAIVLQEILNEYSCLSKRKDVTS